MPNNCLSVLYKHIIQVENKNVGLKVGGINIPLPPNQKRGGAHAPLPPPPPFVTPVVEHWLEQEIGLWIHHEGSIQRPIGATSRSRVQLESWQNYKAI